MGERRGMLPLYFPERVEGRASQLPTLGHVQPQVSKRYRLTTHSMVSNLLPYSGDTMKPCWI